MKSFFTLFNKYKTKINKYWFTVVVFIVITFFIGDYSTIFHRISYNNQIKRLKKDIELYSKEKEKNQEKLNALQSDAESLEKYAREEYRMTKPGEELFIIVE